MEVTVHLFQRFIQPKAFEARVTVVGDRVFAVAIHANSEITRVDWRADYDALDYAVIEPPEPVTAGMLECNPAGAYGWLEQALNLPITSSLADLLANGANHGAHRLHRSEPART